VFNYPTVSDAIKSAALDALWQLEAKTGRMSRRPCADAGERASTLTRPRLTLRYAPPHLGRLYLLVLIGMVVGGLLGRCIPEAGVASQAGRRRLHQPDQDAHHAGDLLLGGAGHRGDGRSAQARTGWRQGAALLRSGLDASRCASA
jgi:hypothetical protein